jgi:hypothetical protein
MPNGGTNTITKVRMPDGREVAFVDWTDQPLWSTCEFEHGATQREMNLFQYVIGDQVPAAAAAGAAATRRAATERDTNMAAPGSMASTEEMLVYAIKPEVFMLHLDTANDFTDWDLDTAGVFSGHPIPTTVCLAVLNMFCKLQLEISQKIFAQAGFGYFNAGFGVSASGASLVGNVAGRNTAVNGIPSQEAVRSFVLAQHIGGQEKFRVQIINANGDALEIGNPETDAATQGAAASTADTTAVARIHVYLDGLHKRPVS